jgi:hypothetical protein
MNVRGLFAVALLMFGTTAAAAGQGAGTGVSVEGAVGSQINEGGNSQSLSIGFWPGDHIGVLISAERIHLPTEVRRDEHGFAATRGGTTTFASGEVIFSPVTFGRVSPYVLGGAGFGRSRPNVNDLFPDNATSAAMLLVGGGGVRLPLTGHLSAFADLRFVLQLDRSEAGVFLFLPLRGGVAWRF